MNNSESKDSNKGKIIVIVFLIAGCLTTFAYKLQSTQYVTQGEHRKKFFHPYMQSLTMFIGQFLCLLVYYSQGQKTKLKLQSNKTPHKKYIFAIPALSDALSSMLQYMGLAFIDSSTYMMFKGASIVTTAIFSRILIKMKIQKRHIAGCGFAILGLVVVGLAGLLNSDNKQSKAFEQQLIGYVLMLISLIFNGFLYAYQGKLLKQHTIHPLQMIGYQGIFGIIYLTIFLTILSYIPCNFGISGCVYDQNNNPFMQLPRIYLKQVFNSPLMIFLVISGILGIAVFNFGGASVTKIYDALTRSLLNVTKTSVIWIIGIIITLFATTQQYKLQSLNIWVNIIKTMGFIFIITGTLIYNKLIFKSYFQSTLQNKQLLIQDNSIVSQDLSKKQTQNQ